MSKSVGSRQFDPWSERQTIKTTLKTDTDIDTKRCLLRDFQHQKNESDGRGSTKNLFPRRESESDPTHRWESSEHHLSSHRSSRTSPRVAVGYPLGTSADNLLKEKSLLERAQTTANQKQQNQNIKTIWLAETKTNR